jgi:hypothetical protein
MYWRAGFNTGEHMTTSEELELSRLELAQLVERNKTLDKLANRKEANTQEVLLKAAAISRERNTDWSERWALLGEEKAKLNNLLERKLVDRAFYDRWWDDVLDPATDVLRQESDEYDQKLEGGLRKQWAATGLPDEGYDKWSSQMLKGQGARGRKMLLKRILQKDLEAGNLTAEAKEAFLAGELHKFESLLED